MVRRSIAAGAAILMLWLTPCLSAQQAGPAGGGSQNGSESQAGGAAPPDPAGSSRPLAEKDTRTQYPAFLANSFFSINLGYIRYGFSNQQLEPGYRAEGVEIPHLAARVALFGHQFFKYLSAQATYMRPVKYVTYRSVNGDQARRQVSEAFGGVTLMSQLPVSKRVSLYGEGGLGITSRFGIEIDGASVIGAAHFASGLLGAGVEYHLKKTVDVVVGATYSPGRRHFSQPATRLLTTGFKYNMRPLPTAQVEANRDAGFIFPENVARLGYTTNIFTYGLNTFFSKTVPIFWGGNVETRRGATIDYERNVFHTRKKFAFDLGASASYWKSSANKEIFRTLSVYPLMRFFVLRTRSADWYVNYSLAGPSYVSRTIIDGRDTGARFTFQDFMGVGSFWGRNRRINAEIGIKHYSNGNIITRNASIAIPLTLTLGYTF